MSHRSAITLVTAGALLFNLSLFSGVQTAIAATSCSELENAIVTATRAANAEHAAERFRKAESSRSCSAHALSLMGRNVAHAFYRRAYSGDVSESERKDLLKRALEFGRPWQVLTAMADLEKADKRYAKATALYQEALDDIDDKTLNPEAPSPKLIASIHKKAQATAQLAPRYVKRVNRAGDPSGLARRKIRGFVAKRTAVPVHFEYDKAEFTEQGQEAARDMLDYLTRQGAPDVTLIGHTDPRGSEAYNKDLSARRAQAVKSFLMAQGYSGEIQTLARGESEPFEPDDPGSYSQEERWQLDRRVELERP